MFTMNQHGPKNVVDQQASNRACEACRAHKVRCLPNDSGSSKTCQRCARTDRHCVFAAPQRRKQRKRTDTRVAELEREVSAMRALFDRKKSNPEESTISDQQLSKPGLQSGLGESSAGTASSSIPASSTEYGQTPGSCSIPNIVTPPDQQEQSPPAYSPDSDFIERGIISMEEASQLFMSYNHDLVHHYPAVVFTPDVSAEKIRSIKPTLFLAVVAAAAGKRDSRLYSILNSEVLCTYAHRTVVQGEKNLELVQAMLITSIWYFPPGKFAQLKFYEYIHMAATMALDIGLGRNPKPSRNRRGVDIEPNTQDSKQVNGLELEERRTFLACYMITTGVSLSTRRPNMLRCNSWVDECLESLTNSPKALWTDKYLVSWIRLIKITEDIGKSFSFEDPSSMADLSEPRVQLVQSGFGKMLEAWRESVGTDINDAIKLQYYHSQLFLHEISLHDDHPSEDFTPPFDLSKILSIHTIPGIKSSYLESTAAIIFSAQSLLDIILGMDIETLRALPVYNFVRMSYAIVILVKIYISSKSTMSQIGSVLSPESLKLGTYLKSLIDKLIDAVGPKECRAPYTFLGMLMRFYGWFKSQEVNPVFTAPPVNRAVDECWLPPMPRVYWEARFDLPNLTKGNATTHNKFTTDGPFDNTILQSLGNDNEVGLNDQPFHSGILGDLQYEVTGDELDVDQYMLLGGMETFNPGFNSWLPDMNIGGALDQNQISGIYGYGIDESYNPLI